MLRELFCNINITKKLFKMRKFYSTLIVLLICATTFSQVKFFEKVSYRGAFAPGKAMWTEGWCNWDPQNTVYGATNKTVNADITTNTTWSTGDIILLQNKVYVTSGATLTIQPGVIIRGEKATEATLIVCRGSKINAKGTATNPIIFTSNFAAGARGLGDWGGVVLCGAGLINAAGGTSIIEGGLDAVKANYGGNNNNDSSGVLSYVRIEFAGFPFQPDKELNGLTFGAVGSLTQIDHIQCSFTNDDSFEWFGGAVNCKYLVAYRGLDDDFDTDFGYGGMNQFLLGVRDPSIADQSASSTSEGFESDNDAAGSEAQPYTSAKFSNVTLIGPYRGSTTNTIDPKFRRAIRIRRNSYISIYNSLLMDWTSGYHIDGTACELNASTDSLRFKNNIIAGMPTGKNLQVNAGTFNIYNWFAGKSNDTLASTAGLLITPYNFLTPDYRPATTSAAATGADFTDGLIAANSYTPASIGINNTINTIKALVYPNPSNGSFAVSVNLNQPSDVMVTVYDLSGKMVASQVASFKNGINTINFNETTLTTGLYLVKILTNDGIATQKIEIE